MTNEIEIIEEETNQIVEQSKAFDIQHQVSYERAGKYLLDIKCFIKKIKITFDPIVKKAHEAHKEATKQRNFHLDPVVKAETILKDKLKTYERQKEKEAEEARKKAEEERQKKIEEETKRRQVEAEKKAKKEAEVMGIDEKDVKVDKIEEVTPEDVEVEQPLPTIDRVKGLGIRKTWKWKAVDYAKIPREYLILDEIRINKEVRTLKENTNIPGIEAYED